MAHDDWRVRVELPDEGGAEDFLDRLGLQAERGRRTGRRAARPPARGLAGRQHDLRVRLDRHAGRAGFTRHRERAGRPGPDPVPVRHRALAARRRALGRRSRPARRRGGAAGAGLRALGGPGRGRNPPRGRATWPTSSGARATTSPARSRTSSRALGAARRLSSWPSESTARSSRAASWCTRCSPSNPFAVFGVSPA